MIKCLPEAGSSIPMEIISEALLFLSSSVMESLSVAVLKWSKCIAIPVQLPVLHAQSPPNLIKYGKIILKNKTKQNQTNINKQKTNKNNNNKYKTII